MKSKLLHDDGIRTFALAFDKGEEIHDGVLRFATEHKLAAAELRAIGALQDLVVAFFDRTTKQYRRIPIREQVEVLALNGNITLKDGQPKLHAHIVVGKADGSAHGGHFMEGHVWPTLEMLVTETPAHLRRKIDENTGLALLDLAV